MSWFKRGKSLSERLNDAFYAEIGESVPAPSMQESTMTSGFLKLLDEEMETLSRQLEKGERQ